MAQSNYPNRQFEKLTLGYVDQLFRFAYARVGNTQDAEDIVQETYLKGYRSFHNLRKGESARNWLTQILVNTVRDHFRKASRTIQTVEIAEAFLNGLEEPAQIGPEEQVCNREIDPLLAKALNLMPDTYAVPFLLREIYDTSYNEIAGILNVPIGTVMSRLSRARAVLRKTLLMDSKNLTIFPNIKNQHADLRGPSDALQ
jgi:RNA polymerase sigma-70 factor (ECF subfamily)